MILVSKILVRVVHVLAGIDVEVLLLGVLDLEEVSLNVGGILSEVSSEKWSVVAGRIGHEDVLVNESKTEA